MGIEGFIYLLGLLNVAGFGSIWYKLGRLEKAVEGHDKEFQKLEKRRGKECLS
tara:strand:+ start:376 stop:534 length:159 start_codon:yes stop_codon:yes gene_type:complete